MRSYKISAVALIACLVGVTSSWAQEAPLRVVATPVAMPFVKLVAETAAVSPISMKEMNSIPALEELCRQGPEGTALVLTATAITPAISAICVENGIDRLTEVQLGFHTLVMVQKSSDPAMDLSAKTLYQALAKEIPLEEKFVPNESRNWSDVKTSLPSLPIKMIMAPRPGQTRKIFEDEALVGGCREFDIVQNIYAADSRVKTCTEVREDAVLEVDNTEERVEALKNAPPGAVGLFPIMVYQQNRSWMRIIPFDGFEPSESNVNSEDYNLAVPVYIYAVPGLLKQGHAAHNWLTEALSEKASGEEGYLKSLGLTSLPASVRKWQRNSALD